MGSDAGIGSQVTVEYALSVPALQVKGSGDSSGGDLTGVYAHRGERHGRPYWVRDEPPVRYLFWSPAVDQREQWRILDRLNDGTGCWNSYVYADGGCPKSLPRQENMHEP